MQANRFSQASAERCRARRLLDRIADKWSLYVIAVLGQGTKRFTELKREVDGISQRMLTVTLRGLERDGLVSRRVYAVMPPHVEYSLTEMGRTLLDRSTALLRWAEEHLDEIDAARASYDDRAKNVRSFD
ncbi:MAG TPA: helix-turn-helix domain-containing protein [Streptosporangiaceae bacterium]|jgi:DNA-binding HxlR family transcriptional regulator|nr:helix-turn-helix domain-containing protein [Streptosporangiaceae bacterium]